MHDAAQRKSPCKDSCIGAFHPFRIRVFHSTLSNFAEKHKEMRGTGGGFSPAPFPCGSGAGVVSFSQTTQREETRHDERRSRKRIVPSLRRSRCGHPGRAHRPRGGSVRPAAGSARSPEHRLPHRGHPRAVRTHCGLLLPAGGGAGERFRHPGGRRPQFLRWPAGRPRQGAVGKAPLHVLLRPRQP